MSKNKVKRNSSAEGKQCTGGKRRQLSQRNRLPAGKISASGKGKKAAKRDVFIR